jgi:hypothetical protein
MSAGEFVRLPYTGFSCRIDGTLDRTDTRTCGDAAGDKILTAHPDLLTRALALLIVAHTGLSRRTSHGLALVLAIIRATLRFAPSTSTPGDEPAGRRCRHAGRSR